MLVLLFKCRSGIASFKLTARPLVVLPDVLLSLGVDAVRLAGDTLVSPRDGQLHGASSIHAAQASVSSLAGFGGEQP